MNLMAEFVLLLSKIIIRTENVIYNLLKYAMCLTYFVQ